MGIALVLGGGLHLGIMLLMSLASFGIVMIAVLTAHADILRELMDAERLPA